MDRESQRVSLVLFGLVISLPSSNKHSDRHAIDTGHSIFLLRVFPLGLRGGAIALRQNYRQLVGNEPIT